MLDFEEPKGRSEVATRDEVAPQEAIRDDNFDGINPVTYAEARVFLITDNDAAARLIGARGKTVTELRNEFPGVKIKIGSKFPGIDEQVTEVCGPIEQATELLMKIAEITVEPKSEDLPLLTFLVHNAGGLIGTKGKRVTKIRNESGATIKIEEGKLGRSSQTPVTVSGSPDSLEKATRSILEFLIECEPVEVIYTPEMSLRSRGGGWGMQRRRGGGGGGWGGRSNRKNGSRGGGWGRPNESGGWVTHERSSSGGWSSFHNEGGWGKSSARDGGWGPSRSTGGYRGRRNGRSMAGRERW